LTSVTKGFELLNDLLESFKGYQGRDSSSMYAMDMMDGLIGSGINRHGMDEDSVSNLMAS
jgi:hypothetical protein